MKKQTSAKQLLGKPQMSLNEQLAYVLTHPSETDRLFFDWHCGNSALPRRAAALFTRLLDVADSPLFNPCQVYVIFKNNCPAEGCLYDDFRICDHGTGRVLFCVVPSSGFRSDRGRARVMGPDKQGQVMELAGGKWRDVCGFFSKKGLQIHLF